MYIISPFDCYKALPDPALLKNKPQSGFFDIFCDAELWASGRSAMRSIFKELKDLSVREIALPSYICPSLPPFFAREFKVSQYGFDELENRVDFPSVKTGKGVAVLAVNFFGASERNKWEALMEKNPETVFIEDHSFAPFSNWAKNSRADFSFASLRKLLPIPDGAYLRAKNRAPRAAARRPAASMPAFAAEILSAMALKTFEQNIAGSTDASYRKKFLAGEKALFKNPPLERISPYSFEILRKLDIAQALAENFKKSEDFFRRNPLKDVPVLKNLTPERPEDLLSPILALPDLPALTAARNLLISPHSRPVIYWSDIIK
ncbi:MAG: hypothetical protein J6P03_05995 [Opitutales bacterium]|nr:hypothetical protein [Opitutales bacterium]